MLVLSGEIKSGGVLDGRPRLSSFVFSLILLPALPETLVHHGDLNSPAPLRAVALALFARCHQPSSVPALATSPLFLLFLISEQKQTS